MDSAEAPSTVPTDQASTTSAKWLKQQRPLAGRWIGVTIVLNFVGGLLLIGQAWLLAHAIDAVVFGDAGLAEVQTWLWPILPLFLARALLSWAAEQSAFEAAANVRLQLRGQLLQRLLQSGPVRLGQQRTGALVNALSDGVEALEPYYARYLPAMSHMALLPLAILLAIFPFDWLSGVILLVTAPLIPLAMILIGKGAERVNQQQWQTMARLSAHFLDVIQGLTTLKLFGASRREIDTIAKVSDDYRRSTMSVLRVAFLSSLALEFFATVSIAIIAVAIGFRLLWGEIPFMPGLFVLLLAPEFYLPLRNMGTHYHARMEAVAAAETLLEIANLETRNDVAGLAAPDLSSSCIRFDDVTVHYAHGGTRSGNPALSHIDLAIRAGERIAIVGASGAGKSTLFNLLLGFVQPSAGTLSANDVSVNEVDANAWRAQLAWVPQRPQLFAVSVADNIRLGAPQASDQEVTDAARRADAIGFIEDLPQGLATPIGEGGHGLSGGQAQRIALARALLRQAPLLLLDEPTASLDAQSESLVQTALDELAAHCTSLVIAHRLNTVRDAQRILVLDGGRLIDQGTHHDLLARCDVYQRLVRDFEDGL